MDDCSKTTLAKGLEYIHGRVFAHLEDIYPENGSVLRDALRYAVFNSGKKYRPFLIWASAYSLGITGNAVTLVATAIEMIHTYSLVHDDLPCMDNDDIRHNKPAVHIKYGEAMAVLVGDTLLTDAFNVLTSKSLMKLLSPENILGIINKVSEYLGGEGMVLGQSIEIATPNNLSVEELANIHYLKTAKFMELCTYIGGILANAPYNIQQKLALYGKNIGLAFQLRDDMKDYSSGEKSNICRFKSIDQVKQEFNNLLTQATDAITVADYNFYLLRDFLNLLKL